MINWMSTGNYLVVHYGTNKPCIIEKGTDKYTQVLSLLTSGAPDKEIIDVIDVGSKIEDYSEGNFKVDQDSGEVLIDNQSVVGVVSERIVDFYKQNLPYLPLVNFWRNIQQNPSNESKSHLFTFLEANKMPITHDGCFIAYKKVVRDAQGNLVDAYSKTFCNNVGSVVTMDREKVDPNRDQTCSVGLHVAAFNYAALSYSGSDLLEVKVNPKDVVAVPSDYNNEKMRVCKYEVVGINKSGPIQKSLVEKTEIRVQRKLGEKSVKSTKAAISAQMKEEHKALVDSLKDTAPGGEVLLGGLTAAEIVDVVEVLTHFNIMSGRKDMKNKKSIIKAAKTTLNDAGFSCTDMTPDFDKV